MQIATLTKNGQFYTIHAIPNGGRGILDKDNKLVAYKKVDEVDKDWDWTRKDY